MRLELEKIVEKTCRNGLKNEIFSGVSAAVLFKQSSQWNRVLYAAGKTGFGDEFTDVTADTFFDLASLTKPFCTVPSILNLINNKKIDFKSKIGKLFSIEKGSEKQKIEIRHLMYHCSGFAAYSPFFKDFAPKFTNETKNSLIETIAKQDLVYTTGIKSIYSDLGFILLGSIIEQVAEQSLDIFYKRNISEPLGVGDTIFFIPEKKKIHKSDFAATERCIWRDRIIHGEVHDEHSFLMDGVAGHAGLFGNIYGVAKLCEYFLDQWQGHKNEKALSGELFEKLFVKMSKESGWYMGFDSPSPTGSSSGSFFSKESAGHLGFTGTSFWMDPKNNVIVILLTNRVHPTRENVAIRKFRPLFHDAVMQTLLEGKI